jgi:hypothetical protein
VIALTTQHIITSSVLNFGGSSLIRHVTGALNIIVFWDVTPCSLVDLYQHLGWARCLIFWMNSRSRVEEISFRGRKGGPGPWLDQIGPHFSRAAYFYTPKKETAFSSEAFVTSWHGVTSNKTLICIVTSVRTASLSTEARSLLQVTRYCHLVYNPRTLQLPTDVSEQQKNINSSETVAYRSEILRHPNHCYSWDHRQMPLSCWHSFRCG